MEPPDRALRQSAGLSRAFFVSMLVVAALGRAAAQSAPGADHHQHLFSPALAALISPPAPAPPTAPIDAAQLIRPTKPVARSDISGGAEINSERRDSPQEAGGPRSFPRAQQDTGLLKS